MDPRVRTARPTRHDEDGGSPLLRLATIWGCSAQVARERMDRCFRDGGDVVAVLMQAGQHDRLAAKMAPLDASLTAWQATPALPESMLAAARTDAHEDIAEAAYNANPCRETARALVGAGARDGLETARRNAALIEQWEL
jgi:hypothetical protein